MRSKTHFTRLYYPSEVTTPATKPAQARARARRGTTNHLHHRDADVAREVAAHVLLLVHELADEPALRVIAECGVSTDHNRIWVAVGANVERVRTGDVSAIVALTRHHYDLHDREAVVDRVRCLVIRDVPVV